MKLLKVASCNLDQWSMDFDTNLKNIMESIRIAKQQGATFRTGPELEVCGYSCQDHFLEQDTFLHSWQSIARILESDLTDGILCDIGLPVLHASVRYNCRIFLLNRKVVCIRPKIHLANDGNYRETRWFTPWTRIFELDDHPLPSVIRKITGQRFAPFGVMIIDALDTNVTVETCEELFTPDSPNILLGLNGAEIIANGSGSHHSLRKLKVRLDLIQNATARGGGAYLYANQQGCDGDRLYFDGCACVCVNGDVVAMGKQFSVYDVEVVTATIDLDEIRSYRGAIASRSVQAANVKPLPRVRVDFKLGNVPKGPASPPLEVKMLGPQEEVALGPACWLFDFLRRSGASGFFLPLSGGADSAATLSMVGVMCTLVVQACKQGDLGVIADIRRIVGETKVPAAADSKDGKDAKDAKSAAAPAPAPTSASVSASDAKDAKAQLVDSKDSKASVLTDGGYIPTDPKELASRIMHTFYMGTANSSAETRARAKSLAEEIGSYHLDTNIDRMVDATIGVFEKLTTKRPKFKVHGGTHQENVALQNLQARLRMVLSYFSAQLLPWVRNRPGFLLVLGSANVDESLRGYMTKYDCSSADINPIGTISKKDLRSFLLWAADRYQWKTLKDIVAAPPSAELEPITEAHKQSDEADMGMTYDELSAYGRLRKLHRCGPALMFQRLQTTWTHLSAREIADKVKKFFYYYALNRHKATVMTPSYHAENYSPDDNRFDLRPFLYNPRWTRQFELIDKLVAEEEASLKAGSASSQAPASATVTSCVAVGTATFPK